MTSFKVDLGELDAVIGSLETFGASFATRLSTLQQEIAALQHDWLGDAADAQAVVHQRLATGAQEMHAAVLQLHAAARHAHRSYTAAVSANQTMWKQVR